MSEQHEHPAAGNDQPSATSASDPGSWKVDLSARSSAAAAEIIAAERFAEQKHRQQRRLSGQPFITHPRAVAEICLELNLDSPTVCAALLHDTVEDTGASLQQIEEQFGAEVAALVDGVTKISGLNFHSGDQQQAENYRKMIVAMAADIRVVLIKLADRLHNMRTISALPRAKQQHKAQETLEIYAPLAHRLGINKLKWELEDLAFATLHPRKYQELKDLVGHQRPEREAAVEQASQELAAELKANLIPTQVSGRPKHFYSIYQKMTRKGREFNEIFDLTALRVLVDEQSDCYAAIGIIHQLWTAMPGRYKDYISVPKANGYQALHTTVIGPGARPLEIQVRSQEMHQQAEYGVAAHVNYKEGNSPDDLQLPWLQDLASEQNSQGAEEFLAALKSDLLEDEVFVFTPGGAVKRLAAGATPIDFAYAVHTDVGHNCSGARVNGRLVPLHYKLSSGEIVEILTNKNSSGPSRDWLKLATSSKARNKIRSWFRRSNQHQVVERGQKILQRQLAEHKLQLSSSEQQRLWQQLASEQGLAGPEELYQALGHQQLSPGALRPSIERVAQERRPNSIQADQRSGVKRPGRRSGQHSGITVNGQGNVTVRLANCCHPAPGDQLLGYVSASRGIVVHRQQCPNAQQLVKQGPERLAEVAWEPGGGEPLQLEIEVKGADRLHLLEDISRVLAEHGANILSASCLAQGATISNRFIIEISDRQQLQRALRGLNQLPSVFSAQRR